MKIGAYSLLCLLLLVGCASSKPRTAPPTVTPIPALQSTSAPIEKPLLSYQEALRGNPREDNLHLSLVTVPYWGYDNRPQKGQLVVAEHLSKEVEAIFGDLYQKHFPIQSVMPIATYHWSDDKSMEENNTSGYNYRYVAGTNRLSNHASGCAIDINPRTNPYFRNGKSMPPNTTYQPTRKGAITPEIAQVFERRGWRWGGRWREKDWQHFDKISVGLQQNKE